MQKLRLLLFAFIAIVALASVISPLRADNAEKKKKMSYHEWFNQLRSASGGELIFENYEFFDDSTEENIHNHKAKTVVVNCSVVLRNVRFDGSILQKLIFNGPVTLENIDGDVYWSNCRFNKLLRFDKIEGDVWFDTCAMDGIIWEPDQKSEDAFVRFNFCNFYPGATYKAEYKKYQITSPLIIIGSNFETTRLEIDNSVFYDNATHPVVLFSYTNFLDVYFEKNTFNTDISFLNSTVSDNLEIMECKFLKRVDFSGFNFPNPQTDFQYSQIARKIALSDDIESLPNNNWYNGDESAKTGDALWFNRLVASYYKLMSLYKSRGDFESANACYIDIKNLELKRLTYEFHNRPSIDLWFSFGLNYFLRWFSDYGTNPSKALVFSFYTMLLFACIYFFFPSQFSTAESFAVIRRIQWLIHYISSNHKLIDLFGNSEKHAEKEQVLKEFDQLLQHKQDEIPLYIKIIANPLSRLSKVPDKIGGWLLARSNFAKGKWSDFTEKQKVYYGILLAIGLVFYLLQVFVVRCLSSLVLSLNVFSTLGFGAIPVRGLPRYLAIVQGFIGWFFLSIFSASLISQLLQ